MEKILRKVYPGRQAECNNSSQDKIHQKIREVNYENGETQEEEKITQDDRKTENETQECDFKVYGYNRNDEEHEKNKQDNEIGKEENAEIVNNKEEEIEKK